MKIEVLCWCQSLLFVRYVHDKSLCLTASRCDFSNHGLQLFFIPRGQREAGAHFCQRQCAGPADSLGSAADERCLTFEVFHGFSLQKSEVTRFCFESRDSRVCEQEGTRRFLRCAPRLPQGRAACPTPCRATIGRPPARASSATEAVCEAVRFHRRREGRSIRFPLPPLRAARACGECLRAGVVRCDWW